MEYSVSLYSFYSAIQKGELTPLGCVEKAAELGFDAVEAVDFVNFSGTQEEKKAQALELKQAAEKCGLQFSSLAIGADFLNGSDGDQEKEIQRVKDYVDIAALLGAPRMRHDITAGYKGENYRSYESLIPTLAQAVREVVREDELTKATTLEQLELSRRYWEAVGVSDWRVALFREGGVTHAS